MRLRWNYDDSSSEVILEYSRSLLGVQGSQADADDTLFLCGVPPFQDPLPRAIWRNSTCYPLPHDVARRGAATLPTGAPKRGHQIGKDCCGAGAGLGLGLAGFRTGQIRIFSIHNLRLYWYHSLNKPPFRVRLGMASTELSRLGTPTCSKLSLRMDVITDLLLTALRALGLGFGLRFRV